MAYKHRKPNRIIVRWYCAGVHAPVPTCVKVPSLRNEAIEADVIAALIGRAESIGAITEPPSEIPDTEE
jgi:hypothetical protein